MDPNGASEPRLRLGVIGAGGHAMHQIYPCLSSLPADLAAVCDLDQTRARRAAQTYGGESVFTDHSDMLRDAGLDAVIVCVGGDHHAKLAIDVMEAGLPVWTEKPPATSAAEAETVLATSHVTGKTCMIGFMKRFAPVYRRVRAAVESPDFGPPSLLSINWSFGVSDQSWIDAFLLDFGIHMIDLSRFFFGEVSEVYAYRSDTVAYAVTLAFANGAVGTLSMTPNRGLDITEETALTGGFGQHVTVDSAGRMLRYQGSDVIDRYERPLALQDSLTDIGYLCELQEFVQAIRQDRQPESSIASACESMRLHDAIVRSVTERRAVPIGDL